MSGSKGTPLDHLMSAKKPVQRKLRLCSDHVLADEYSQAQQDVRRLEIMAKSSVGEASAEAIKKELAEAEAKLAVIRKEVNEVSVVFTFQSIGRRRYEDLVAAHPPTEDQLKEAREKSPDGILIFNPDTFPLALISVSLVDPKLSIEDLQVMNDSDNFNAAEMWELYQFAEKVNQERRVIDLGNASRQTRG